MDFQRPSNVPDHAELCLKAISDANLGDKISLGGAFGLLHYLDYRATYDVDAWWTSSATSQERQMVIGCGFGFRRSSFMSVEIDGALYPDVDPPAELVTLEDQVDFLARLCAAADFGVLPAPKTVTALLHPDWRPAMDACRLLTSPTYHLLRRWQGLPPLPYLGQQLAYIRDDPNLAHV